MIYNVSVEGLEELDEKFKAVAKNLSPDVVEPILFTGATTIADAARSAAPIAARGHWRRHKWIEPGNLRRGIIAKTLERRGTVNLLGLTGELQAAPSLAAINYRVAPHAHLVEFGTVKMAARPFFAPAVESKRSGVEEQITRDIVRAIEEAWNK